MDVSAESSCVFKCALVVLLIVSIIVFIIRSVLRSIMSPYPQISQTENERFFIDPSKGNAKVKFPSILSTPSVYLTVIVPSYNEQERLPAMLDETFEYLEERKKNDPKFTYEIIVVDDGSKDNTTKVALKYVEKYGIEKIRVLTQDRNRGKGGAIRMGVIRSRGQLILFADADGATKFSDFQKLENKIKSSTNDNDNSEIICCGSRRHLQQDSVAKRSLFRTILMYGFHFLVWFLCVKGVRDTQCGFKLFTRSAAVKTFSNLHIERWAFDVDLLYIASYFNMKIFEVDVNWEEKDGSKVTPASWIQMGKDLLLIRIYYIFGAWKLNENLKME